MHSSMQCAEYSIVLTASCAVKCRLGRRPPQMELRCCETARALADLSLHSAVAVGLPLLMCVM